MSSVNSRLKAYSVLRRIGKGSYGEVYLVTAGDGKKQYVMKKIKLTCSSAKERLGAEQEAALLSHLHHPNIVSYKESFQDDSGVLHIVMGYCEGGDLHSRLKTHGDSFLPETKVVEWFVQIALGLQYLHDRNILHRDLKTQNIFLSKNDIIKVGDLGIARVLDGSCDLAHTVIGTPYYMSPELFANQPYNHKSDIWALGCCVHEIASLKHAFSARNINALMYKVIQGKAPPIPPHYSMELVQLVQQMLAQRAEARPGVHQILRKAFIRKHIQMFLDRAAGRKRKGRHPPQPFPTRPVRRECGVVSDQTEFNGGHREILEQAKIVAKEQIRNGNGDLESVSDCLQSSPQPYMCSGVQKVPRPLPPNPNSDHSSSGEVVSSARQRRRKSKLQQEGRGKIILRPSDEGSHPDESRLCTSAKGDPDQRTSGGDPDQRSSGGDPDQRSSGGDPDQRAGGGDPDQRAGGGDPDQCTGGGTHDRRSSGGDPDQRTGGDDPDQCVDGDFDQHTEFSDPEEGSWCTPDERSQWNGRTDQDHEVDDFYTLLDSTLHLSEVEAPSAPLNEQQPSCHATSPSAGKDGKAQLPSGRLAERIRALRMECEFALGTAVVHQVMELLNGADPEDSQEDLKLALGTDSFDIYAAKLQQLKLCQDSLFFLS